MRATFSIDDETQNALNRMAKDLKTSKSAIVRRAVIELATRCDRLTEAERQTKLAALRRLAAQASHRTDEEVEAELRAIRTARQSGWRPGT